MNGKAPSPWFTRAALLVAGLATLVAALPPRTPSKGPDFERFGRIPVVSGGRLKPLDTVARNALLETSGKSTVRYKDDKGKKISLGHNAWLAEVLFDNQNASTRPVILVENEQVKALFHRQEDEKKKRFSMADMAAANQKIESLSRKAYDKAKEGRNIFEKQLIFLYQRLTVLGHLRQSVQPPGLHDYKTTLNAFPSLVARAVPETRKMQRGEPYDEDVVGQLSAYLNAFQDMQGLAAFYPVPPEDVASGLPGWRSAGTVVLDDVARGKPNPSMASWARIADAYRIIDTDNGAAFNAEVDRYLSTLENRELPGLSRASAEWWFNHFAPFTLCMGLYLVAFLCVLAGWLTRSEGMTRAAFALLAISFLIHTLGLAIRIGLSDRPPVTNLYSSAVFIGWGVLALALLLERFLLRNGIASSMASLIGFTTLIIAHHLSIGGDTMEVKRAVLDSNLWLTTHVIVVTLGYSATFAAGIIAIIWLVLRLTGAPFLDEPARKTLTACVYGITCFALLFSFVGTILGGIWADQSWGRFWGWDPKENGALIIVLWTALILHARWAGIIREKGIMVLAIGGNIVTGASWFGTNLLQVGLHTYGFTESGFTWLMIWFAFNLALMILAAFVPHKLHAPVPPPLPPPVDHA